MLKRYKMYYSEAVGKIEMYLLCQKYHMSDCVKYEQNSGIKFLIYILFLAMAREPYAITVIFLLLLIKGNLVYTPKELSLEETEGRLEVKCCRYSSYTQKVSFRIVF